MSATAFTTFITTPFERPVAFAWISARLTGLPTIIAAAIEANRNVKILEQLHQSADHPINAFHPEGEYLKGLVIQVDWCLTINTRQFYQ